VAIQANLVVGAGSAQELISSIINLGASTEEVKQIYKTVIIDNCRVQFDKVIVDGRLRKDILYKTLTQGTAPVVPGNIQGITGVVNANAGNIAATDVDIAFTMLIPVPCARPGDRCEVIHAFVEGEKEEAANLGADGLFTALIDKSIVFVCLKVIRPGGACGHTHAVTDDKICPAPQTTGLAMGAPHGQVPFAQPGVIPGSWVGPTLLFPGFINPGRPTGLPPSNPARPTAMTANVQVIPVAGMPASPGIGGGSPSPTI
jgi:hypothetical protein